MVLDSDEHAAPAPRVYVENHRMWRRALAHEPVLLGDVDAQIVDGGGILPLRQDPDETHKWAGGVIDVDGQFVAGQVSDPSNANNVRNIIHGYPFAGSWQQSNETVIWGGGRNIAHFGHALLEWPARLWWRIANGSQLRVAFTNRGITREHPLMELLARGGLGPDDVLIVDRPTRFRRVIVPDQALYPSGPISIAASRTVYNRMRDSVPAGDVKKVYLTRSQLPAMPRVQTVNEEVVEDAFARRGFTIVAPERLNLRDQISLLAGADEVATTGGTLSHLAVFCRDGAKLHLLPRVHSVAGTTAVPRVQWSLNLMRNIDLTVVEAVRPPVLPVTREWGVSDFGMTAKFEQFLAVELDGLTSPPIQTPPARYSDTELGRLLREWAALVDRTPQHVRHAIPTLNTDTLSTAVLSTIDGAATEPLPRVV